MLYDKLMNPKGALTALMLSMLLTGSLSVEAARKKTVQKIKVACVGNSITYGTGIEDREHFYFVQLSSLNRPSWTWFRDSQMQLMKTIPNTGMAVSSDYGDSLDVHPTNKQPVGERLGRWALNQTYGHGVTPSGPIYNKVEREGNALVVSFAYGDGLRTSDGQSPRCFEIAGEEGMFYPAQAKIEGDQVRLTSPEVKLPRFVRYGWQPFTRANLVNSDGLPASTFRGDTDSIIRKPASC